MYTAGGMIHHIVSSVNIEQGIGSTLGHMHRSDFSMDVMHLLSLLLLLL